MAGKKILVADDSLTIQKVIRLALSGDGYEIQTVSDGQEAVEQASLFRPDICIIDVSLPTKDAYQIRQEFMNKPDLRKIPVILMSSAFEKVDESRMNSLGFAGHLIKPFDPSHLRSTLLAVSNQAPKNDPIEESIIPDPEMKTETIKFEPATLTMNNPVEDFSLEPTRTDVHAQPALDYRKISKELDRKRNEKTQFTEISLSHPSSDTDLPPLSLDHSGDDIQQLTKNTFEMSGLDQQDWGVIEPMKEEGIITSMDQMPGVQVAPGNTEPVGHYGIAPTVSVSHEAVEEIVKAEVAKLLESMQSQIKTKIQTIFDEEYKHYTQARMPELAERVIKEEIHKLLNDPPT